MPISAHGLGIVLGFQVSNKNKINKLLYILSLRYQLLDDGLQA